MNAKARELLRAAKQKKIDNPTVKPEYQIKIEEHLEDTENTSKEGIKVSDTSDNSHSPSKLINNNNLFQKKQEAPKILINNKPKEAPKKIIQEIVQKEYEAEEPLQSSPVKEVKPKDPTANDRLMKRMISAKTQKQFAPKAPSRILGMADNLEAKLKFGGERKKFLLDDSDIQKIEIKTVLAPIKEEKVIHKQVDQILMEKPVVNVRKMTKREFKI